MVPFLLSSIFAVDIVESSKLSVAVQKTRNIFLSHISISHEEIMLESVNTYPPHHRFSSRTH